MLKKFKNDQLILDFNLVVVVGIILNFHMHQHQIIETDLKA